MIFKHRAIRKDNDEVVYGSYFEENHLGVIKGVICFYNRLEGGDEFVEVEESSVSIFFGKKDKNGKEIYTNDKVKYKGKEYQVRYFEEYGVFGLYDEKNNRPLGRSGSSTKYEPYFFTTYHTRQMELV